MGTAQLCGLASCLGLWLNKQVKSSDKGARWSLQPHLHPQPLSPLLHSQSSSGLASPTAILQSPAPALVISNKSWGHCDGNNCPLSYRGTTFTTSRETERLLTQTLMLLYSHPGYEMQVGLHRCPNMEAEHSYITGLLHKNVVCLFVF